ncbi:hypothetical protein Sjap_008927 [Stephania japonica]|uniref:Uncharacterized protein n=1 Tax=Stephania japonica TaxID=461633 RepID=A0AAP0JS09_9MAGN
MDDLLEGSGNLPTGYSMEAESDGDSDEMDEDVKPSKSTRVSKRHKGNKGNKSKKATNSFFADM